ncbi:hypothetical protein DFH06DRAFT_1338716 [Mycena polygramma]|nr:hypothetical protein DFH06DRAFT_1338716 [Mycena polygramma]
MPDRTRARTPTRASSRTTTVTPATPPCTPAPTHTLCIVRAVPTQSTRLHRSTLRLVAHHAARSPEPYLTAHHPHMRTHTDNDHHLIIDHGLHVIDHDHELDIDLDTRDAFRVRRSGKGELHPIVRTPLPSPPSIADAPRQPRPPWAMKHQNTGPPRVPRCCGTPDRQRCRRRLARLQDPEIIRTRLSPPRGSRSQKENEKNTHHLPAVITLASLHAVAAQVAHAAARVACLAPASGAEGGGAAAGAVTA